MRSLSAADSDLVRDARHEPVTWDLEAPRKRGRLLCAGARCARGRHGRRRIPV